LLNKKEGRKKAKEIFKKEGKREVEKARERDDMMKM